MSAAPNLSLYGISMELLELFAYRDEIAADPDITPAEQAESLKVIDAQIDDYVARELDKADGIAANLGEFGIRAETCRAKAKHEAERARFWEARIERLESATLRALQLRPKDKQRIETASTTIKIAKNPPSVNVVDASEVPKPYMRRQVTLNADLYDRMMAHLMVSPKGAPIFQELQAAKTTEPEPMKVEILKELKAKVPVAGCKLIDDRVRLVVE